MSTLPTIFVSHGAPTYAGEPGLAGEQLFALAQVLGKPEAIVIISPHWMTSGVKVTTSVRPETIHDFGGFPPELYEIQYPAPGAPELAARAAQLLATGGMAVRLDDERGLDHGAWVPLMHMYPEADVPVVQVSIPFDADERQAYELGRVLAPLASEGVLIIGSGSLTHNLREFRMGNVEGADYVHEFCAWMRNAVGAGDTEKLMNALSIAPHAGRAHPTTDHYLPVLVAAGAAANLTPATVIDGGVRHGVLAMESYVFGQQIALSQLEASHV